MLLLLDESALELLSIKMVQYMFTMKVQLILLSTQYCIVDPCLSELVVYENLDYPKQQCVLDGCVII